MTLRAEISEIVTRDRLKELEARNANLEQCLDAATIEKIALRERNAKLERVFQEAVKTFMDEDLKTEMALLRPWWRPLDNLREAVRAMDKKDDKT